MKTTLFLLPLFLLMTFAHAQKKNTYFDSIKAKAQNEEKKILLIFKGSDWCAPCIKLEMEILNTEEFKQLANKQFITIKADFPRKKKNQLPEEKQKQNAQLAEEYNKSGYFPYVVILNAEGKTLGSLGYEKSSPARYFEKLNAF